MRQLGSNSGGCEDQIIVVVERGKTSGGQLSIAELPTYKVSAMRDVGVVVEITHL